MGLIRRLTSSFFLPRIPIRSPQLSPIGNSPKLASATLPPVIMAWSIRETCLFSWFLSIAVIASARSLEYRAPVDLQIDNLFNVGIGNIAPGLPKLESFEAYAKRDYFYVGGQYVEGDSKANGTIRTGQMYVERLTPQCNEGKRLPLVVWPGGVQTASNFLNTPDGRPGWASYFLSQGYTIVSQKILSDWTLRTNRSHSTRTYLQVVA